MGRITEEMALEYHKCRIYKEFIEQLRISEKNEKDGFMNSLRCSTIYIPTPDEITEKYGVSSVLHTSDNSSSVFPMK